MADVQGNSEFKPLLRGIRTDAQTYFERAEVALEGQTLHEYSAFHLAGDASANREQYWSALPEALKSEANRLNVRVVSLMGQISRPVRRSALTSEADQRDLVTAAKTMRAALFLRRFRSWDTEILNDEDQVLGVTPAGQSENDPLDPNDSAILFADWAAKVEDILDLLIASDELLDSSPSELATRYRPGTAFVMMWMDKSQPHLVDIYDAVKDIFAKFDIRAIRSDDIEHEGLITQRILDEIRTAEFLLADLSGGRPNVYYEVGYAHALGRRVVLYRKKGTGLHFDLAGYNCPEYENLHDLRAQLAHRLSVITSKQPKSSGP